MMSRFLVKVILSSVFVSSLMSCGGGPKVEVWVVSELRDDGAISSFDFVVRDVHLQPAGFEVFADHRVSDEWVPLELLVEGIDLVEAQHKAVLVASGDIPQGSYDRIFMRPSALDAADAQSQVLAIKNVMEPTAVSFSYDRNGVLKVVLEVISIATRGGEDYSVFAKDAYTQSD